MRVLFKHKLFRLDGVNECNWYFRTVLSLLCKNWYRSTLKILEISNRRLGIFGQCFLFCEKLIPIGAENSRNFESGFFGQTEGICSSPARGLRLVTKKVALNHANLKYIFRNYSKHIKTIWKYFLQRWALFSRRHVGSFFNTASL